MPALLSSLLDTLPSPLTTLAKLAQAVGILDSNIGRLNNASFGRDTVPKTIIEVDANYSLDLLPNNDVLLAVTSAASPGAITITMPATGNCRPGQRVQVYDRSGNANTYNITISRNGNTFDNAASNQTISTNLGKLAFICIAAGEWMLD